jgi:hypothetical protein
MNNRNLQKKIQKIPLKTPDLLMFVDLYSFTYLTRREIISMITEYISYVQTQGNNYNITRNISNNITVPENIKDCMALYQLFIGGTSGRMIKRRVLNLLFPNDTYKQFLEIMNNMRKINDIYIIDQLLPLSNKSAQIVNNKFIENFDLEIFDPIEIEGEHMNNNVIPIYSIEKKPILNDKNIFYISADIQLDDIYKLNNNNYRHIIKNDPTFYFMPILKYNHLIIYQPLMMKNKVPLNGYFINYGGKRLTLEDLAFCKTILHLLFLTIQTNRSFVPNNSSYLWRSINNANTNTNAITSNNVGVGLNLIINNIDNGNNGEINQKIRQKPEIQKLLSLQKPEEMNRDIFNKIRELLINIIYSRIPLRFVGRNIVLLNKNEYTIKIYNLMKKYNREWNFFNEEQLREIEEQFIPLLKNKYNITDQDITNLIELANYYKTLNKNEMLIMNKSTIKEIRQYIILNDYLHLLSDNKLMELSRRLPPV